MKSPNECWAIVNEYPEYQVSNLGRVKRTSNDRIKKATIDRNGYHIVGLSCHNVTRTRFVHRLMAHAFLGYQPNREIQARHLDGDKDNNRLCNIAWGTRKENAQDTIRLGRQLRGLTHPSSKLSAKDLANIVRMRSEGASYATIGKRLNVCAQTACSASNGKTYK